MADATPCNCETTQALRLELHDTIGATAELAKRMHRRLTAARLEALFWRVVASGRRADLDRFDALNACRWLHREFPEAFA